MSRRTGMGRERSLLRGLVTFGLILVLAVGAGYAATKYIITPYLNGSTDEPANTNQADTKEPAIFSGSAIITNGSPAEDTSTINPSEPATNQIGNTDTQVKQNATRFILYSIQYGSFQSKEGAKAVATDLGSQNITTLILYTDGTYKVIGSPYTEEEKARKALTSQKETVGEDIFLTTLEATLQ